MTEPTPKRAPRPPSKYRIEVNRPRCTGVGTCMEHAPRTFEIDDDAVAYVRKPNGDDDAKIFAAAESCPMLAILLFDADSGERVWPPPPKRGPPVD